MLNFTKKHLVMCEYTLNTVKSPVQKLVQRNVIQHRVKPSGLLLITLLYFLRYV